MFVWLALLLSTTFYIMAASIPPLPKHIVLGYASWNQCNDKLIEGVRNGVNVLIWFSIDFSKGTVQRGPDLVCVRSIISKMNSEGFTNVVHLISIGGWNAAHIDTAAASPLEYYAAWNKWNKEKVAGPGFPTGFHGFDWDLEGNDDLRSQWNVFTQECLDSMGTISQLAKKNGYYVTMAPAQSYMSPWTSEFSRSVAFKDDAWETSVPGLNFPYHGRNLYSYVWAKYGPFDLTIVQLYEGYSHTLHSIRFGGLSPGAAVASSVRELLHPWKITLDDGQELTVKINPSQLIVGLANGWADGTKFLFVDAMGLSDAWYEIGGQIRGFGFWNVGEEGTLQHGREPIYLAKELKAIMEKHVFGEELR
ncbi:UNVERIFIED_CONTAM: hypothetical protein HDU68_005098 [Siphonaria sp. JEL0065]|nr:hypothetical protein HDU68_005098 [Siphonaria sp. JEL0065]